MVEDPHTHQRPHSASLSYRHKTVSLKKAFLLRIHLVDMDASDGTLDFTDAFGRLNNSTRLAILRELATVQAESPFKPTVAFSKLRERVGEDDPGTFNYHLNQLRGVFVRKTDDGYRLSPDGRRFAVLVATGGMDNTLDEYPQEIDDICPVCGGQFTAVYRDGAFGVECPNDHRYATRVPRSLVNGRSSEEALAIVAKYAWSPVRVAMAAAVGIEGRREDRGRRRLGGRRGGV